MSLIRLYVEQSLTSGVAAELSDGQAHYLRNVMRREEGDALRLFNAVNGEFDATIIKLGKKGGVAMVGTCQRQAEVTPDLWLLFAPVKRGPTELIVQKATELGVSVMMPVQTERTNGARLNLDRLSAIAIEAAEQCERLSVPSIHPLQKLDRVLSEWPKDRSLIFCDEAGDNPNEKWGGENGRAQPALAALSSDVMAKAGGQKEASAGIVIGPEGGFTSVERAQLRAHPHVTPITLGPRILRADTAAIAAITLWQAALGDFRPSRAR